MSEPDTQQLFHKRGDYRRSRVEDTLRSLPLLGLALWLLPLVWRKASDPGGEEAISLVSASIYLFAVWVALVFLAWIASAGAMQEPQTEADTDTDGPR